jgi:hypothetical protein
LDGLKGSGMSVLHRDNLNEINLKSLPGFRVGGGRFDPFIFLGIQFAFTLVVLSLTIYSIYIWDIIKNQFCQFAHVCLFFCVNDIAYCKII